MDERKSIFELPHVRQNPEAIKEELEDALKRAKGEDRSQKIRIPMWVIEDALALIEKQRWISVEEKMPKERESIFARFKGTDKWSNAMFEKSSENVRVVIVFADGTRRVSHSHTIDGKWECEKSPLKRTVTHWMPNPDLPT